MVDSSETYGKQLVLIRQKAFSQHLCSSQAYKSEWLQRITMTWVKQYTRVKSWLLAPPEITQWVSNSAHATLGHVSSHFSFSPSYTRGFKSFWNNLNPRCVGIVLNCSTRYILWQQTSQAPAGPRWPPRRPWSSCASPLDCRPGWETRGKGQSKTSDTTEEKCYREK